MRFLGVFIIVLCANYSQVIAQSTLKNCITTETKQIQNVSIKQNDAFHQSVSKRTLSQHQLWDDLLNTYVNDDGRVNYKGFINGHGKLLEYIKILGASKPIKGTSKNHKLAYWINAYNALTIDLILCHYPINSIKDIKDPWKQKLWKLGEKWYSLNDIEHSILRKMDEPRIHFAIVCASYSCPKLLNQAYTEAHLEQQLSDATKKFLSDTERNEISQSHLKLSKIFQWFNKDFRKNGPLIDFINQYTNIEIFENAKINYKTYNWSLNE